MKAPVFQTDWSDEVKALYRHDMQEIWDKSIAPQIWNQYHNQLDLYLQFADKPNLDVLDVGCAQGTLALMLAERGHRVTAVDIRREFLRYAQSRYTQGAIEFVQANILEGGVTGQYDLVFANQLVEHLVYPEHLLEAIQKRLKPGGRVVMTTPNADYFKSTLPTFHEIGDRSQLEHLQHSADGDGHFYAYRADELTQVFRETGYQNVRYEYFETPIISGHVKVRYLHRMLPSALLSVAERIAVRPQFLARKLGHQLLVTGVKAPN